MPVSAEPTLPFPARINPGVDALKRHLDSWVAELNILPDDAVTAWSDGRYERLVARMYPTGDTPLLELSGEVVLWLFLYDDVLDPGGSGGNPQYARAAGTSAVQILDGRSPTPPEDPVLLVLWQLRERLLPLCGPAWWQRLVTDMRDFTESLYREVEARVNNTLPDIHEYLAARRFTSGWPILTDLVELTARAEVPAELRRSAAYADVRCASGDVACTINDILSLRKEITAGERHNLVLILQDLHGFGLDEAMNLALRRMADRLGDYLDARGRFLAHDAAADAPTREAMTRYVTGLESLMRGSLDWSLETGRYRSASSAPTHAASTEEIS